MIELLSAFWAFWMFLKYVVTEVSGRKKKTNFDLCVIDWTGFVLFDRLQYASTEQHLASGNCPETHRHTEAGDPLWDLHPAEQPVVRRPVQPGCSHLPGRAGNRVGKEHGRKQNQCFDVCHIKCSSCTAPNRWLTSWRSWPRLFFLCPCWDAGWASTSGCLCSFSWLEWLLFRSGAGSSHSLTGFCMS